MKKVIIGASLLLVSSISPLQAEETKNYITVGGSIAFPSDSEGDSSLGGTSYDDYVQSNVRNNYLEEIYATSTNPMREAKIKVTAFTI